MMVQFKIHETDLTGQPVSTYVLTSASAYTGDEIAETTIRIDVIPAPITSTSTIPSRFALSYKLLQNPKVLLLTLLHPFLPTGYPHTVTPDYTPYQIYDSIQAFSSTIASLLASRAVLVGLGVGDATSSATAAMLLSVAQETIGRIATIFFAHWAARRIETEVKFYRFLADIVNDVAFVLDCLSPSLPGSWARVPVLGISSACRAICGVAGGSSKAILSAHFAQAGNIGELNAKDGSQETVVTLIGMWIGGLVVSTLEGPIASWICLLVLLGVHLWANWKAVSAVRLRTLNRARATILFDGLLRDGIIRTPEDVGKKENTFKAAHIIRGVGGEVLGSCRVGTDLKELLQVNQEMRANSGSFLAVQLPLNDLLRLFRTEKYLLWYTAGEREVIILLKEKATGCDQLKAWSQAVRLLRLLPKDRKTSTETLDGILAILEQTLAANRKMWDEKHTLLEEAGWDISASSVEVTPACRILPEDSMN